MRAFVVVVGLIVMSCAPLPKPKQRGSTRSSDDETAAEYQRRKARESGELDDESAPPPGAKWGGWKYQGEREDCRFVYGRKCFTKREPAVNACKASRCKTRCTVDGGGPATVSCSKT